MAEFDLIALIRARAATRGDMLLGIGDDAALLRVPAGHELVVTADTLNEGVHFPAGTAPADIGWKALAANLSDLASMGARPALVHAVAVAARPTRRGWRPSSTASSRWRPRTASPWSVATPPAARCCRSRSPQWAWSNPVPPCAATAPAPATTSG